MKTKKKDRNPDIFEDKKSQFMNLSQFDTSDNGFEWDQQLDEEERKEIILARSELQQAENVPLYRHKSHGNGGGPSNGPNNKLSKDDFFIMKVIGRGGFGKVYMVKKRTNGKVYAMKVLSKD